MSKIPSKEELEQRKRLTINAETVGNAASTDFPGHWPGENNHGWDRKAFKEGLAVQFHPDPNSTPMDQTFSLTGIDTSIANAFRRILISEVSTIAIENIYLYQNTSVIQDEVLASRIGLIPFTGPKSGLDFIKTYKKPDPDTSTDPTEGKTDINTIELRLSKKCTWKEGGLQRAVNGETDPELLYENHSIYARDIEFTPPEGSLQQAAFAAEPFRPTNPDVLIVKMRPGQEIDMRIEAFRNIGQVHAKWSPVATASYRLLPTIDIIEPITGDDAKKFAKCFPQGVIALEPITAADIKKNPELKGQEGEVKAVVKNPMRDTVSRECLRHAEFKDKVKLGRVRDHFIFRIESTGQIESDELFRKSVGILKKKCQQIRAGREAMMK